MGNGAMGSTFGGSPVGICRGVRQLLREEKREERDVLLMIGCK